MYALPIESKPIRVRIKGVREIIAVSVGDIPSINATKIETNLEASWCKGSAPPKSQ